MIVICCGMYRAASTWQYNVACHLVEELCAGERLGYVHDGPALAERLGPRLGSGGWFVVKAHEPDPLFADLVARGEAAAVHSYRDVRDVAYSVAHKRGSTFEREVEGTGLLAQTVRNFQFWSGLPRVLSQRYEAVTADPVAAVRQIAAALGLVLPAALAEGVAREFSLENNRDRSARLAADLRAQGVDLAAPDNALRCDGATQLHWNHIRDGRSGGWRQAATPRHLAVLARGCGRWLIEQGYERDWAWALPALEHLLFDEPAEHQARSRELAHHLERHQESLAGLHEHLASERARAALLVEELAALRQSVAPPPAEPPTADLPTPADPSDPGGRSPLPDATAATEPKAVA